MTLFGNRFICCRMNASPLIWWAGAVESAKQAALNEKIVPDRHLGLAGFSILKLNP